MSYLYHDYILNYALNVNGIDYFERADPPNHSNSYIINQIFYNSDKLTLNSNAAIETNYRDIDIFKLRVNDPGTSNQVDLNCCVAHLKAGNSEEEAIERANETSKLMMILTIQVLPAITPCLVILICTLLLSRLFRICYFTPIRDRFYDPKSR